VRVPEDAGKAKVTLSFAAWKDAEVAPTTFDLPIEDAAPAK
jgi:hypothetical protein